MGQVLGLPGSASAADYTDLFVLQLWPYASVYVGAEGKFGGEATDRAAGFWRALHLSPPAEPDHLAALLGLYASLAEAEEAEPDQARSRLLRSSRQALLWEHLLTWVPVYVAKLAEVAPAYYRGWGQLLRDALLAEAAALEPPDRLPLSLREAPPLPDPREEGAEAFVAGLLAPARSGMILVRDDLVRAARELGLGLRQGERAFVLKALLGQEPTGTLAWLGAEVGRASGIHAAMPEVLEPVREFWSARARAACRLIASVDPIAA